MNSDDLKIVYVFSCVILGLIILSPTLYSVISFPEGEKFSEMWLLGSNHMIESGTMNVTADKRHSLYLGVGNHMGGLEYYAVYVKFRDPSEPLPDTAAGFPSPLAPIFEYRLFLKNNETLERNFDFSFPEISFEGDVVRVSRLSINGHSVYVNKILVWDEFRSGFYCQLFFELWIYNTTTTSFQFHNRAVGFWLNVTETY